MSHRTMQRFNTIKDQFMALMPLQDDQPNADIKDVDYIETLNIWEKNGMIRHITGKVPDELDSIIDMKYTRMDCKIITDKEREAGYTRFILCSLLERIYVSTVINNCHDAVVHIITHYIEHIRKEVYEHTLLLSWNDKSYKTFNYLTTQAKIPWTVDYVKLFITISHSMGYYASRNSRLSKSIIHIIRMIMRNSHKVPYSSFREMFTQIVIQLRSPSYNYNNLLRFMLTNIKKFVADPYDFNERYFKEYGWVDRQHNLFFHLVYTGNSDMAMILFDICGEDHHIDITPDMSIIDFQDERMHMTYMLINEGFSRWDSHTNVEFIEWYYLKTNKEFDIVKYVESRSIYEIFMGWYGWALHLHQLLQMVRKYCGKNTTINLAPYNDIRWNWLENIDNITDDELPYSEKHNQHIKHVFSYGCIKMVDKVKEHAKFLI